MNEEVKELIDTIKTLLNEYSPETSGFLLEEYVVDYTQLKGLLDYINGLEERIEYLERSNDRREETIIELRNEVVGSNE